MSVLTFLKFSTFRYSHHSKNSHHHSNQLKLVILKMNDTSCLSVTPDILNIHDIHDISLEIPRISIIIQIILILWFRKGVPFDVCLSVLTLVTFLTYLTFQTFLTFPTFHHFWNSHNHSNQLEFVFPIWYDICYDIPTIPEFWLFLKLLTFQTFPIYCHAKSWGPGLKNIQVIAFLLVLSKVWRSSSSKKRNSIPVDISTIFMFDNYK